MALSGRLKSWDDDRGFGFIEPEGGGKDLFVHISAFPRHMQRPAVGDSVTYEAGFGRDGRERAIRVLGETLYSGSAGAGLSGSSLGPYRERRRRRSSIGSVVSVLLFLGVGGYLVTSERQNLKAEARGLVSGVQSLFGSDGEAEQPGQRFFCDGRVYCSQMTSCEEALFFIRNCPGTKMDGDRDGVPCESQWCGH